MWTCSHCNAEINESFDACWNCGTSSTGIANKEFLHADEYSPRQHARTRQVSLSQMLWTIACACLFFGGIASNNYFLVAIGVACLTLTFACSALGK